MVYYGTFFFSIYKSVRSMSTCIFLSKMLSYSAGGKKVLIKRVRNLFEVFIAFAITPLSYSPKYEIIYSSIP